MASQAITREMTDEAFDSYVMGILARELGLGGFVRYIAKYRSGKGDYTAWRQNNPDPRTIEEILLALEAKDTAQTT